MSDDVPELSADTLAALAAFRAEQEASLTNENASISEDWQLSQFWYNDDTSRKLVREGITTALKNVQNSEIPYIGCVSSPTLVRFFHETEEYKSGKFHLRLFEYDDRFGLKFPDEFVHFDYKSPTVLPPELVGKFDVIIADPPFLAAECLIKTAHSVRLLGKPDVKIVLCTGAIMEDYAARLLAMHRTEFEPKHANNLANDFACFANYQTFTL
ncbi:unnamed protein product [Caenorhabditis angaria]|uniref:Protein-lysine N-methyltransferase CAMP_LOCUS8367 n=1 Tax=Caenorhabditis angaria TaxID=860376 RepID=A0A9P1IIL2_9PELO|nr:unnamed protein product [Caenorhabditis angaria]